MRGKGLKRSHQARSAHRLGATQHPAIAAALKAGIRGTGQLTPCPRIDQGQTSCCHACSAAAVCWVARNAAGKPLPFVPSQVEIASATYADVRAASTPVGLPLPPLTDDGAELQDDATAMQRWGVCPMAAEQGRYCDIPNDVPGTPFPEPVVAEIQAAASYIVAGEYQIDIDDQAPNTVAACIDASSPVWLGTFVDTAFEELRADEIAGVPDTTDPNGGGHALYISGYRTNAAGELEFRVENSWGSGWCDNGACWASTAWLTACWNLWPFAVTS